MKGKVYLTGAGGRVGKAVLNAMPDAVPLVRHAGGLKNERVVDFSNGNELEKTLSDASVLVHIAGSVKTYDRKELWESNYGLTKRLLGALPQNARVVFAGTVSVYGKRPADNPADENTPVNPDTEYAKSKYEAEKLVRGHPDHVVLRIGTVYGPEFEDYFYVLELLEKGKMRLIGDGANRVSFVHVDDVAAAFAAAVSKGEGIYVITGECRTQKEIYTAACKKLGVAVPAKSVSPASASFAAGAGELLAFLKPPKITREHVAILSSDRCFNCNRARRELGFSPRGIEEGIAEIAGIYAKRQRLSTER